MTENCSQATPRSASLSDMRMELQRKGIAKAIHEQKRCPSTAATNVSHDVERIVTVGVQKFVGFTIELAIAGWRGARGGGC